MQPYTSELDACAAVTNHGERVIIVGPALDPARVTVCPYFGTEHFTPLAANLTLERVGIMRANRLAHDDERARAWQALMAYASNGPNTDARAIENAAEVLCDAVTYRLNN